MENTAENQETEQAPGLIVTEDMRSYIYETAKWANFLAIVGFIISALMVLFAFSAGATMGTNPGLAALFKSQVLSPAVFTFFMLLYALAIFYPSLLMFRYAGRAKLGVLYTEQDSLSEAMAIMKSLFKYYGILVIIVISLYLILIIFAIGAAALLAR
jgi:hypothetical protein